MPRYFIISDIHGNLTGLHAVLQFMDAHGPFDGFFVLGDFMGGGSGGGEILDLLVERQAQMVRGNHEELQLDLEAHINQIPPQWLDLMRKSNEWLYSRLTDSHWKLLGDLPLTIEVEAAPGRRFFLCHSTPADPWAFACRPDTPAEALQAAFGNLDAEVILFGHFHEHYVMVHDGRLLVNVASIGLRSDGLSACTILTFENERWNIQQFQVPYDTRVEEQLLAERNVPRPQFANNHNSPTGTGGK